jgi:folate-dependent phosphoribosylglycinamide formyltransferase PurN
MNILLLTMDEPMYMPQYLEPVVSELHDELSEVVIAPHPSEDLVTTAKQRFEMFGPISFLKYGTHFATGKVLGAIPPKLQTWITGRYHSVTSLCRAYGVPIQVEENVNRDGFVKHARALDIDVILSISCGQKLGSELLEIPSEGAINLHGSLLPDYRGRATAFWALYHNESHSGVTAHFMTEDLDDGDIIRQERFPIADSDTMHDVYNKVVNTGSQLAIVVIELVRTDGVDTEPNPSQQGEFYSLPDADARREFHRRGNKFR